MFTKTFFAAAALTAVVASSAQAGPILQGPILQRGAPQSAGAGYTPTTQSMKLQTPKADPAAKHLKKGDRIRIGGLGILQARNAAVGQRGLRRR